MKKIVTLLTVISVLSLIACSNNEDEKVDKSVKQDSELIQRLSAYNNELFDERGLACDRAPMALATRSRGREILVADALGAIRGAWAGAKYGAIASPSGAVAGAVVGGILNGAGASLLVWWATQDYKVPTPITNLLFGGRYITNSNVMYQLNSQIDITKVDSIIRVFQVPWGRIAITPNVVGGVTTYPNIDCKKIIGLDNRLIDEVGAKHNAFLTMTRSNKSVSPSFNPNKLDGTLECRIVNSIGFASEYSKVINAGLIGGSLVNPEDIGMSKVAIDALKLFVDAYSSYPNTMNEVDAVVNYYVNNIAVTNELKVDEKRSLLIGFVVAAYTARYWSEDCVELN